jgi:predicted nucleic acid-binding protein
MAQAAVLDTTVLYAFANRNDTYHATARPIVTGIDRGDLPSAIVPDPVLLETVNGLHRDLGHAPSVEVLERLEAGSRFQVTRDPRPVWNRGRSLFREHEALSLADGVIAASALHHEAPYIYSFDGGFDAVEDITRLDAPVDPYAP